MEINKLGLNEFYGHSAIIKQYCGYPEDLPLPLVIQHGCDAYYNLFEINAEYLFDYWVWDEAVQEMNIKKHHLPPQTIHVLGSPFIYLADEVKLSLPVCERKGTIAFPQHSTPCGPAIEGFQDYARQLQALPEKFHPITVCLHPYDISQGLHIPFQENGFTVICCLPDVLTYYENIVNNPALFWQIYTQSYSPFYLTNFIKYCASKKYATANFSSSPTYYSIYLGLKFFWYGNKTQYTTGPYHRAPPEDVQYYQQMEKTLSLTDEGEVPDSDTLWQIAYGRLGVKHKLGKDELLSYLNNLYQSRPYVEGLRQKFVMLNETQVQVQNLEVQLQQSNVKVEQLQEQFENVLTEKDTLQVQFHQEQLVREICLIVLKQSPFKLDWYSRLFPGNKNRLQMRFNVVDKRKENAKSCDLRKSKTYKAGVGTVCKSSANYATDDIQQSSEQAISSLKQALELDPTNLWSYHKLGQTLLELDYFEEGILCYCHALSLDNNLAVVCSDLAEALVEGGYLEQAIICYRHLISLKLLKNDLH